MRDLDAEYFRIAEELQPDLLEFCKKIIETKEFSQNTYEKDNENLKKEINELKSALNIRITEIKDLNEECGKYKAQVAKIDKTTVEPINYNSIKSFEKQNIRHTLVRRGMPKYKASPKVQNIVCGIGFSDVEISILSAYSSQWDLA